jgi:hypothetical protein
MNEKWECYLCGKEDKFNNLPDGYLGNYHPLCLTCANDIYYDNDNEDRFRLTYHIEFGDLLFWENQLLPIANQKAN